MAGSPRWKVYSPEGEYVASCRYTEDAAAVVALYSDGASIKDGHGKRVWIEGVDGAAGDSFDHVTETIRRRTFGPNPGAFSVTR